MYPYSEDVSKNDKTALLLNIEKYIFMVSSPFHEMWQAGEKNQWHQDIFRIIFYVESVLIRYNKLYSVHCVRIACSYGNITLLCPPQVFDERIL